MSLTGMVDKRTLEKYEREAREKSRESWYLSWALDTNQEGKLVYNYNFIMYKLCN
jgi:translation elongation factor EF-1alpha